MSSGSGDHTGLGTAYAIIFSRSAWGQHCIAQKADGTLKRNTLINFPLIKETANRCPFDQQLAIKKPEPEDPGLVGCHLRYANQSARDSPKASRPVIN